MNATILAAVREAGVPTSPAIVTDSGSWTFQELCDAAERLAGELAERHDTARPLAVRLADPVAATVTVLASDAAGIPLIHCDPATAASFAAATVGDRRTTRGASSGLGAQPVPLRSGVPGMTLLPPPVDGSGIPAAPPRSTQTFLTSGSTGRPVGVVRTAAAILADARRVAAFLAYGADAPVVVAAPLFHAYGFNYGLVGPMLAGAPVRHCPARSVPSQLARVVRAVQARTLIALPFHYGLLADALGQSAAHAGGTRAEPASALAGLVRAVSAGGPLPPGAPGRIARQAAFQLYNCYGSSEAGAVTLNMVTGAEADGEIGTPLPGVSLRTTEPVDPTLPGELLLRSESLAVGRLGPDGGLVPLPTRDGWYATGDLARPSTGGGVRLAGRLDAVINVGGRTVSLVDIEHVLRAHPGVADAHVQAEDDGLRGQVPAARVVLRSAAELGQVLRWCRDRLEPHQMPRRIEAVTVLPRSATGKVLAGHGGPAPAMEVSR
ncbi:fatty acid--CoA ligase family protein [Micromonospora sp. HUAS YX12]|uniref:Fatty acid--CoA ligase family protein n=1 Tax=Micromonospora sp. HUAS YX12 TaxID=3156396 RepID=A0AAU7R338_9ACTN